MSSTYNEQWLYILYPMYTYNVHVRSYTNLYECAIAINSELKIMQTDGMRLNVHVHVEQQTAMFTQRDHRMTSNNEHTTWQNWRYTYKISQTWLTATSKRTHNGIVYVERPWEQSNTHSSTLCGLCIHQPRFSASTLLCFDARTPVN